MPGYSLVLGNKNYSSWSLRPWLVMKHLNLGFDEILIPLFRDGFKEKLLEYSASGKVPVLKDEGLEIWDSLAICEYLNEKHPEGNLWPKEIYAKAVARAVSCEMHSGFFTIRNDMSMDMRNIVEGFIPSPICQSEIDHVIKIWTSCRERFGGDGAFLFGSFSIADAMFAPIVSRFTTFQIPLKGVAQEYAQTILNMDAMKEWTEAAKKEEWVIVPADYG